MKLMQTALVAGVLATSVVSPALANEYEPQHLGTAIVAAEDGTANDKVEEFVYIANDESTEAPSGQVRDTTPRPNVNLGENNATVTSVVDELYNATEQNLLEYDPTTGTLYFNIVEYNALSAEDRRTYMGTALPYISDSSLDKMYKNRMYNFVAKQDTATTKIISSLDSATRSNLADASRILQPFSSPFTIIMGLITILVFAFLGFSAVIDMFFMAVPISRGALKRRKQGVEGDAGYYLVSPEAVYAVRAEDQSHGEKSALGYYIKKRSIKMIAIGIIMLWFMQGEILHVIVFLIEAFRPLWESFTLGG